MNIKSSCSPSLFLAVRSAPAFTRMRATSPDPSLCWTNNNYFTMKINACLWALPFKSDQQGDFAAIVSSLATYLVLPRGVGGGDWRLPGCNIEGQGCGKPGCHMSAAGGSVVYLAATWRGGGRAAVYRLPCCHVE
jgi:hypothetical protein